MEKDRIVYLLDQLSEQLRHVRPGVNDLDRLFDYMDPDFMELMAGLLEISRVATFTNTDGHIVSVVVGIDREHVEDTWATDTEADKCLGAHY